MSRPPGPPTSPSPAGPASPVSRQWAAWASTGPAMGPRGLQLLSRSRREPNCPFLGHWWEVSHQPTKCTKAPDPSAARLGQKRERPVPAGDRVPARRRPLWGRASTDHSPEPRARVTAEEATPPALTPLPRAGVTAEGGHAPSPDAPATCSGGGMCFPGNSAGEESTCNAADPCLTPELGRSAGKGIG